MKQIRLTGIFLLLLLTTVCRGQARIRINQAGYLPQAVKVAVLMSKQPVTLSSFELCDALTGEVVWRSGRITPCGPYGTFPSVFRLDFSAFGKEGGWYLRAGSIRSPVFRIGGDVYNGSADFLLQYLREQQCGYNPVLQDSCHIHDGYVVYDPPRDSTFIDVVGGWHDATDYLRYVTTSANTVFQMLFAWQQNPSSFGDRFFLPPYEWYNADISRWCRQAGLTLINYTPGTSSNQDWTWPGPGRYYVSSDTIFRRILEYEKRDPHGLNGFILLTHPGTDPRRPDRFYDRLDELITLLKKKGYVFTTRFE